MNFANHIRTGVDNTKLEESIDKFVNDTTMSKLARQIIDSARFNTVVSLFPMEQNKNLIHWLKIELGYEVVVTLVGKESDLVEKLHEFHDYTKPKNYIDFIQYVYSTSNVLPKLSFDYSYVELCVNNELLNGLKLQTIKADDRENYGLTKSEMYILEGVSESEYPIVISGNSLNAVRKVHILLRSNLIHPKQHYCFSNRQKLQEACGSLDTNGYNSDGHTVLIEMSNHKNSLTVLQSLQKYILVNVFDKSGSIHFHVKPIINKVHNISKEDFNVNMPLILVINPDNEKVVYDEVNGLNIPSVEITTQEEFNKLLTIVNSRIDLLHLMRKKTTDSAGQVPLHFIISSNIIANNPDCFKILLSSCRVTGVMITVVKNDTEAVLRDDIMDGFCKVIELGHNGVTYL